MKKSKIIMLSLLFIITIIVVVFSVSYAYVSINKVQSNTNTFNTICFSTTVTPGGNKISLNNTYPMSDAKGKSLNNYYNFTVKNNCSQALYYQVMLNIKNTTSANLLPQIFYSLDGSNVNLLSHALEIDTPLGASASDNIGTYLIESGTLSSLNASKSYNLRMWIGEHAGNGVMGQIFEAEVIVYSTPVAPTTLKNVNLTNMISDPSFENNGWSINNDNTRSRYGNNSLKMNGTTSNAEVTVSNKSTMNINNTHKYYGRFEAYPTIAGKTGGFNWPSGGYSFNDGTSLGATNKWNIVSGVNTRTSWSGNYSYRVDFNHNNSASTAWYDGAMMVDLTAAFGAGNEPSKEWCDANIPYFEGTKKLSYINTTEYMSYKVENPDSGTYMFQQNDDGYYESNNKGVNSSYALAKITFTNTYSVNKTITVSYINYAESNYDYGIFSNLDTTLSSSNTADTTNVALNLKGQSLADVKTFTYSIPPGTHYFYIKFRKDGSGHTYNDSIKFNISY